MFKEIFVVFCLLVVVMAFPAEDVESQEPAQTLQIEAEPSDLTDDTDLEGSESRHYGGYGRGYGGYGRGYGGGYGGYGYGGYGGGFGYGGGYGGYGGGYGYRRHGGWGHRRHWG